MYLMKNADILLYLIIDPKNYLSQSKWEMSKLPVGEHVICN